MDGWMDHVDDAGVRQLLGDGNDDDDYDDYMSIILLHDRFGSVWFGLVRLWCILNIHLSLVVF